jgi:teichuronic acid biosynthesis glycosyltransferase TuaG
MDRRGQNNGRQARVAVIMPCHNGESTLAQAIESVLQQSFADWELLIVDDGSTDGSRAVIDAFRQRDPRIRLLSNPQPSGASSARNRALGETDARFVAFLDSDDAWKPKKLELQLNALATYGAALACSAYEVMDGDGIVIGSVNPEPGVLKYDSLLGNNPVGTLTAVLDRELCGDFRFNTALPKSEDYYLWLNVLKGGRTGICLEETLASYRVHGKTLSSNKLSAARNRWRVYRDFEKHDLPTALLYFTRYAVSGIVKMLSMRRKRIRVGS